MNRIHFIVGASALFTAVFVAVAITFREAPQLVPESGAQQAGVTQRSQGPPPKQMKAVERGASTLRVNSTSSPGVVRKAEAGLTTLADRSFSVSVSEDLINQAAPEQREKLIAAAGRVEVQARRELASLSRQFDLTPAQEKKIFPLLVHAAADFQPGFLSGGGGDPVPVPTGDQAKGSTEVVGDDGETLNTPDDVEDAIYNELDPDQQEAMVDAAIDNQLWWSEIVDQLEADLDSAVGEIAEGEVESAEPIATNPVEEPATEGIRTEEGAKPTAPDRGNIFDL